MKKRLLLTFLSVLSIISTIRGQEIGANFNESISEPLKQVNLLKKSGVTWVRGFIDLPLHLLENEGEEGKQKIVGVKEEVIKNYQPTWDFIQAKKILGDNVHFILSLKIPFERYEEGVPKVDSEEKKHLYNCVKLLLETYDLAKYIDILVMGNEPMWEHEGLSDADDYYNFLNDFADTLTEWKNEKHWNFEIFAGSLNRTAELHRENRIIQKVMKVVEDNVNISGLDLHVHSWVAKQAEDDMKCARETYRITKKIISTEFSVVNSFKPKETLGQWGTAHGYPSTMKLYEYLNQAQTRCNQGNPVPYDEFLSVIHSFDWYPKHWYKTFYKAFKKYNVYAITGRFSCTPGNLYTESTVLWDLGSIYSSRFMGTGIDGLQNPSPLVWPDFIECQNGLIMKNLVVTQNSVFFEWGNMSSDNIKFKLQYYDNEDSDIPEGDIQEKYTLIKGLKPNTKYKISLLDGNNPDEVIYTRDFITATSIESNYKSLKVTDTGNYIFISLNNISDDVDEVKFFVDGVEISEVQTSLNGQELSAVINYGDGTNEVIYVKL